MPASNPAERILIAADRGQHWSEGSREVWLLDGHCLINQGLTYARSAKAVLWVDRDQTAGAARSRITAYLENDVSINYTLKGANSRLTDQSWIGNFVSTAPIEVRVAQVEGEPAVKPTVYHNALARRNPFFGRGVHQTQFVEPIEGVAEPDPLPPGNRRLQVLGRSDVPVRVRSSRGPGDQWIVVVDGGVTMVIDGVTLSTDGVEYIGSIDISTDRLVFWTVSLDEPGLDGQTLQADDTPLEIYMEGNVVFRQGDRVIYAQQMYYDVRRQIGTIVQGEMLTPVPEYDGILRLKAALVQQTGPNRFFAEGASITSSLLGSPTYRLQSGRLLFENIQRPLLEPFTGEPVVDPLTGEPVIDQEHRVTGFNNLIYLGPVPVFYWPKFSSNLEDPTLFIKRVRFRNDNIFGTQVLTDWDGYELLGIENPLEGTEFDVSADYLSKRGFAGGTTFTYDRPDLFGFGGRNAGFLDAWSILKDHGTDNLGLGRRSLVPERDNRFRILWRHRHELPADWRLSAEAGWISDNNFLEEYFENEWDEFKDESTDVQLKRIVDNSSWSLTAGARINKFFTVTEQLPRGDHFWLGQSLLGDRLTWYEHSHAGYLRLRTATVPTQPQQQAAFGVPLPWEVTASGERVATRQEIDLPVPVGPVKVVPYALGELAHWGEGANGDDIQRAYGQVGVRASLPIWAASPFYESNLWNVHGLAHKMVLDGDFFYADASEDLTNLAIYDPLDDNSIEAFRRRFAVNTFGGVTPIQFDERFYAVRTGIAGNVTSPVTEIAEDLTLLRLGMQQRLQTKRGLPGQRRIIDWVTMDTNLSFFPNKDRDNFGEPVGLLDYDLRWHVGDRVTLVSDGTFDFFTAGQQIVSVGGFLNRPPRGNLYLGFYYLEGPFSSQVLSASYSYRMSPKWVSSFGTSVDVGGNGNIGQFLALTRIGESFLTSFGFTSDASKDNIGVTLAIEPRFLPQTRLGRAGGAEVARVGLDRLE